MLSAIFNLAAILILAAWLHGLVNWDGKKGCKPEDCDTCPFPHCEDRPINKNERKD